MNGNHEYDTSGPGSQQPGQQVATHHQLDAGIENTNAAKKVALVVYALQVAAFFIGITSVVGLIINYVKKDDVRGTWLESHFRWQIRTFWFAVLWSVVGLVLALVYIGWLVLFATACWYIYRVVKGWLKLNDNKPMYR